MEALISAGATILLDAVGDGITIQDVSGRVVYANPAAARVLGFDSPAELLATPSQEILERFELFDEKGNPLSLDELPGRAALAGQPESERILQFREVRTNTRRWSIVKAQPVHNQDGSIRFALNIFHDITDQIERQRALEEASSQIEESAAELEATISELELRTEEAEERADRHKFLAEAGRLLASSLETESNLRMVAHLAVPHIAEWTEVSLLNKEGVLQRMEIAHNEPDKLKYAIELDRAFPRDPATNRGYAVARSGVSEIYPILTDEMLRASTQSDEQYQLLRTLDLHSAMIVPMKVPGSVLGIITFIRSRSQKPFNEEDLEFAESLAARAALALANARLFREAQEANRAKADFLAVVSHELRTPLTAIFGYTELLTTGVAGEMNPAQQAHLDRVHASATHLLSIIEDILAYARTEAGRDQLHRDTFRLSEVIAEAVMIVRPNAEKKGLRVATEVGEDLPLRTDRAKVRQILINLLGNAVKFTDEGSITVRGGRHGETQLFVTVEDTGVGIQRSDFDRIFEPFRQLEPSMTRKSGGTGLGLAVSRRFAALLGGTVTVDSAPGQGSRFTLTLPLEPTS